MRIVPLLAVSILVLTSACGDRSGSADLNLVKPAPRRTVVWLGDRGLDEITAAELRLVGVDGVVVRRGVLDLAGNAPVLGFIPMPELARTIPFGVVLRVEGAREGLGDDMADAVWRAVAAQSAGRPPSEVILDLPEVPAGMAGFVKRLATLADVPIVPLLSVDQLQDEEVLRVADAAGICLIPVFGTGHPGLRGVGEGGALPMYKKLEPLVGRGVAIRIGIGLRPMVDPGIAGWGDDLNPLTEPENSEVRTASALDRTFVLKRDMEWSGRPWTAPDRIAVRWWDASRLHASFAEIDRLVLPDVVGWDLAPLPPPGRKLGMGEEVLIRYLAGEGPAPEIRVDARRTGRTVRVSLANAGPFVSAVSGAGNWLEVSVSQGSLVVNGRGSFDTIELGSRRGGGWKMRSGGVADAIRFGETYLAPFEELETGSIRLSVSRARVKVRWHFLLSSGEQVTGELAP